jgi:hypothetical protein
MTLDYWMIVPLVGIALTIPAWAWLWLTRGQKRKTPAE